jgi:hypothetical protein
MLKFFEGAAFAEGGLIGAKARQIDDVMELRQHSRVQAAKKGQVPHCLHTTPHSVRFLVRLKDSLTANRLINR